MSTRRASIIGLCCLFLALALSACGDAAPAAQPTAVPTKQATAQPTAAVAGPPAATAQPTTQSTTAPTAQPEPTAVPTSQPAPTAAPMLNAKPTKIIPLHITIKHEGKILVDTDVVTGGVMLTADGRKVPWTHDHLATWYAGYCGVGSFETCRAYVTAHRWRWKKAPEIPAPFARLPDVRLGDEVIVTTAEGDRIFIVKISQQIGDDDKRFITNKGITKQVLTMVTCTGTTEQVDGTTVASDRWVVQAEPANS